MWSEIGIVNQSARHSAFPGMLLISIALGTGGCGPTSQPEYSDLNLSEVSGRVTLDGAPLVSARIEFEGQDGRISYGHTDESGSYLLYYDSEQAGVVPGSKTVRITSLPQSAEESVGIELEDGTIRLPTELVPARYNQESELSVVVDQTRQTFDFDLQSVSP